MQVTSQASCENEWVQCLLGNGFVFLRCLESHLVQAHHRVECWLGEDNTVVIKGCSHSERSPESTLLAAPSLLGPTPIQSHSFGLVHQPLSEHRPCNSLKILSCRSWRDGSAKSPGCSSTGPGGDCHSQSSTIPVPGHPTPSSVLCEHCTDRHVSSVETYMWEKHPYTKK